MGVYGRSELLLGLNETNTYHCATDGRTGRFVFVVVIVVVVVVVVVVVGIIVGVDVVAVIVVVVSNFHRTHIAVTHFKGEVAVSSCFRTPMVLKPTIPARAAFCGNRECPKKKIKNQKYGQG